MGQLAMALMAAILLQAPTPKAQAGMQTEGQAISSVVPATSPATTSESTPEAGATSRPMSSAEANAAIDKLRQTVRESIEKGRGPTEEMSPEAQKAIAETADKFLSDPAIRDAIAGQIRQFDMPDFSPFARRAFFAATVVPITFFALVGLLVWLHYRSKQARMQAQMAAQTQLLGKFNSGTELAAFLASPGGQQFLGGMGTTPQINPRGRVLKHVGTGAVLATLGFGMLFSGHRPSFAGVVILSVGIGFLVSAAASYSLSKKMGLLNGESKGTPGGVAPPQ